ncbi:MAG: beta-ketoacyl-ACP synthase II [Anaerolineales bacterium]|nr:beta-ketoacyl-ACP synthase II [Anaerolineales bacterium]
MGCRRFGIACGEAQEQSEVPMERVVITGAGTVNPLGLDPERSWNNALAGLSAAGVIQQFDPSNLPVKIACEVKGFDPADFMDARTARRIERFQQFALAAARQAVGQSGLDVRSHGERVGVVIATTIGGMITIQEAARQLITQGPRKLSPFTIPMLMPNGAAGLVGIEFGARGPGYSIASACASGADGIGAAWRLIRSGEADAMIAGSTDATICELGMGAFVRLGAMTSGESLEIPKPFDKNRDGLVMGEGAAVLVMESLAFARRRGAKILAELAGYGATMDSFHITAPAEDGSGSARAIELALASANVKPQDVDYINAHGTGTVLNDRAETRAIKRAFGQRAYKIPVSSTKSMTGHMMGTTGALEAVFCMLAIRDGRIPPTIHYSTPDPDCDLDYVPNTGREMPVRVAVSNAFGFGGHNAVLVIRAFEG